MISGAVALFVAAWLLIAVVLVTGHDPALSKQTASVASSSSTPDDRLELVEQRLWHVIRHLVTDERHLQRLDDRQLDLRHQLNREQLER